MGKGEAGGGNKAVLKWFCVWICGGSGVLKGSWGFFGDPKGDLGVFVGPKAELGVPRGSLGVLNGA